MVDFFFFFFYFFFFFFLVDVQKIDQLPVSKPHINNFTYKYSVLLCTLSSSIFITYHVALCDDSLA